MTDAELKEIEELQDELICKGGGKKGQPKVDADPNKLERLRELLEQQRAEAEVETPVEAIEEDDPVADQEIEDEAGPESDENIGIKKEKGKFIVPAKAPVEKAECSDEAVELEREIRRYVKKSGGFRADMADAGIRRAKQLLKKAGRTEPVWNHKIAVPGMRA